MVSPDTLRVDYAGAVVHALKQEMERDTRVFV